jgi:hypothetical protein
LAEFAARLLVKACYDLGSPYNVFPG